MVCPKCGGKTTVVDCTSSSTKVFRIRKCKACDDRIYTVETITGKTPEFAYEFYKNKYWDRAQKKEKNNV